MQRYFSAVLCAALLGACAASPDGIPAAGVNQSQFAPLSCPQLTEEARVAIANYRVAWDEQKRAREDDITLILFVGWFSNLWNDGDESEDRKYQAVAQTKGVIEAVEATMRLKDCAGADVGAQAKQAIRELR